MDWAKRAVKDGSIGAKALLAWSLENGIDTEKDVAAAAALYW
jgi:hypothetical protein